MLAHADHIIPCPLGRDEMQIGELGDGMTHLLVDRAGDLASLNMGERHVVVSGRCGGRERLVTVGHGHDQCRGGDASKTDASSLMPMPVDLAAPTRVSPSKQAVHTRGDRRSHLAP